MYNILISPGAKKQIDRLSGESRKRAASILTEILAHDPHAGNALKADLKGLYSYRFGDYRIIYNIVKHRLIVQILNVMHRREVYR